MNALISKTKSGKALPVLIGAAVLFIAAVIVWIRQVMLGMDAYSDQYAWGVYVAAFFTAAAAGLGVLILAGILQVRKGAGISSIRLMYLAAAACFVVAGLVIMADLGSPEIIMRLVSGGQFAAPMVWDFWVLALCFIVAVIGCLTRQPKAIVGILAIASGLLLLFVESWLAVASEAQQLWSLTLGGPVAVVQAAVLAFAVALLIAPQHERRLLSGGLAALLAFAVIGGLDMAVGLLGEGRLATQWQEVARSPLFWLGAVVLGVLIPALLLLVKKEQSVTVVKGAACLMILGVLSAKWSYIWAAQAVPVLHGLPAASPAVHPAEIIVTIGFTALGVMIYLLGEMWLRYEETPAAGRTQVEGGVAS